MTRLSMSHNTTRSVRDMAGSAYAAWLECVMIQSLYRDRREAWLGVCHDTIVCFMTGGRPGH